MVIIDNSELTPVYKALDIAAGYLTKRGYGPIEARDLAIEQIATLYRRGERRALMLANLAISAIEREVIEHEAQTGTRAAPFRSAS